MTSSLMQSTNEERNTMVVPSCSCRNVVETNIRDEEDFLDAVHDQLPIIDLLSDDPSSITKDIVRASEEYGFFKVINHGVPLDVVSRMEEEVRRFFSKPLSEKLRAGPPNPYGYGRNNIGFNGDTGELEYLLLHTNSAFVSHKSQSIFSDPATFRSAVMEYVEAVRGLACEILDHMGRGLGLGCSESKVMMSGLIRDSHSDSLLRFNHYPPAPAKVGFGEHTDPQMLTILRSTIHGLQISLQEGRWLPVTPYPDSSFCVNVGDALQVMSNGRFKSVRHKVVNSYEARTSMVYFAAPPLDAVIRCLPGIIPDPGQPTDDDPVLLYRSFTWAEYKTATYAHRLGDHQARLNHFRFSAATALATRNELKLNQQPAPYLPHL